MVKKLRVGVVFGGESGEHEVSLAGAASVMAAIDRDRFEPGQIGITREGRVLSAPPPRPGWFLGGGPGGGGRGGGGGGGRGAGGGRVPGFWPGPATRGRRGGPARGRRAGPPPAAGAVAAPHGRRILVE